MGETTKITWTDATVNLWWGCTKIAEGCKNCYAAALSKRYGHDVWGVDKERRMIKGAFPMLEKLQRKADRESGDLKVFVGSMMDIFEDFDEDSAPHMQREFFLNQLTHGSFYPNLHFQFLTKRPDNIRKYIPESWFVNGAPNNVWFGVSASTQGEYNRNIHSLYQNTPIGSGKFMSLEPMIEQIFTSGFAVTQVDWLIIGGESGNGAREFHPSMAKNLVHCCEQFNVPVFVKQMGTVWAGLHGEKGKGLLVESWPEWIQYQQHMPIRKM